jgi:hypothetical protein
MSIFIGLEWKKMYNAYVINAYNLYERKSKTQPHGLYTPLLVPKELQVDISMDFSDFYYFLLSF